MNEIKRIALEIDGIPVSGNSGDTILKIAEENGIHIPTLCHHESVNAYGGCGMCVVEAEGMPKLMRACSTKAAEGMKIHTDSPRVLQSRKISMELLMSDHEGDCRGPCMLNCPAGTDCQRYIKAIANGNDHEAIKIVKEKLPLPASIGRVCPHPCEKACRRKLVEQPISIARLKAFAADRDLADHPYRPQVAPETGKKVAILGGGPAGLTAAYFLRQAGHTVTIYDAMPQMGGMLRYGIPAYRLPKEIVDREVAEIEALGVTMKNNVRIGQDLTLEQIQKQTDAVIVAIGAWQSSSMRCTGEQADGVLGGIDFLREVALWNAGLRSEPVSIGKRVVVVGGGNTAMDACRSAIRCGAEEVTVLYRRTRDEMPAEAEEITEAEEEGVRFRYLRAPLEILTGENGHVKAIRLQVMQLGEPDASGRRSPIAVEGQTEELAVDTVISAIGQTIRIDGFESLERNRKGMISADENTFRTSLPGVFAIGDATNKGADIAIAAIGEGNRCAEVVNSYLHGCETPYSAPYYSKREVTPEMLADRPKQPRATLPLRNPQERRHDFREVCLGLDETSARNEAKRCLECGCHDYEECKLIRYARMQPIEPERFSGVKNTAPKERKLVCIERDPGKCVLCGLCVRICDEVAHKGILGLVGRGFPTKISPEFRDSAVIADCASCHRCADACPTGALKRLPQI